ncbi:MAG: cytochrome c family protein [Hyphomonadaceae bacterium]|nr:cytochrome c family protein [Hyphomonadaceae bacterium]
MSDLKVNSIAGVLLASVLGVMGVGTAADAVFHPHWPEKAGFMPEIAEAGGGPSGPAQEGPPDFGRLFADPVQYAELVARGERGVGVCKSCHTFQAGGADGIGPNLHDVFGRRAATHPGFSFSQAMHEHTVVWSYDTLNEYLRSPSQVVRGTRMAFAGIRNTNDRVAVLAYLRSIAPSPPALPAPLPEAAPAAAAPAGAAAGAAASPAPATPATPAPH